MQTVTVLGFPDYEAPSRRLAASLGASHRTIGLHRFPDGESRVTMPPMQDEHAVICRSLDHPNDKLIELLFAARTARASGIRTLTLAAPYLCYMRQDVAFHPGEAVSQSIVGTLLAELFDHVVTVDPHLHRTTQFEEAVPARRAIAVSAAPLLGGLLRARAPDALLIGPDSESRQWVGSIARSHGFDFTVCNKVRSGDRLVAVEIPAAVELLHRHIVLVDDMASTGRTLGAAATQCLARGANRVDVLVVHGLFSGDAIEYLRACGVRSILSSDSIVHDTNVIPLAGILADAVRILTQTPPEVQAVTHDHPGPTP